MAGLNYLIDWLSVFYDQHPWLGGIVNAITLVWLAVVTFLWVRQNFTYKEVDITPCRFKVKRKDFTVQNVTNIVSLKFFNGGHVSDEVRNEILSLTNSKVKDMEVKENS